MKILKDKYIATRYKDKILTALVQQDKIVQLDLTGEESTLLNHIYIGKVKNIVSNIQAAFIDIGNDQICYYSFENNKHPIFTNKISKNKKGLSEGDELIIQLEREGVKTKAPVVSSNLNFAGKYVILTHGKTTLGISNKIIDKKWRTEVREALAPFLNGEYGFIIRTNAKAVTIDKILEECLILKKQYDSVREAGLYRTCYSCLWKPAPDYISGLRDLYSDNLGSIITDQEDLYEDMQDYLMVYEPEQVERLSLYTDILLSLSKLYSIQTVMERALNERVWLKSGGYLVIQPTEALVVIDVNTGKFAGKKNQQETILKINLEAAKEIAFQIRLRNLSGIVIVDFIDLLNQEDKDTLMEHFGRYLHRDPIKTTLVGMTKLSLVELTRKKIKKPLYEQVLV